MVPLLRFELRILLRYSLLRRVTLPICLEGQRINNNMNLYVFGNSIVGRARPDAIGMPKTFVDILFEKYNIPDNHLYGYALCSEERILYFLKKIKEIDIAIIFHGLPECFFVPALERDFSVLNIEDYFWKDENWSHLNLFPSISADKPITNAEWKVIRSNGKNFENFIPNEEFKSHYYNYLKYFYTHDLCHNRHYGALAQIDQYLTYKKIPVIHCTLPRTTPTWFKFSSGIIDDELATFQYQHHLNHCSHAKVTNAIDEEGNRIIADRLISYIEQLGR